MAGKDTSGEGRSARTQAPGDDLSVTRDVTRDELSVQEDAGERPPHPDDPRKPASPTELSKPSWKGILVRTFKEFVDDDCTDSAAALTYYSVLSLFPALIVLVSLLGLLGQGQQTIDALLSIVRDLGPAQAVAAFEQPLQQLVNTSAAGAAFGLGLLGAIWSASGYTAAFSRVMNRIYEVEEGRPFWKLRPLQILITVLAIMVVAAVALSLVLTGPLARAVGDAVGLGDTAVTVWSIVKWPVVALVVSLLIAGLYYATPNVRQPKFRWFSLGSTLALVTWIIASVGFGLYVANFASYNKTYGALAGVIVFLLWLWITNCALLFGAEFDAEMERGRQLQAGMISGEDEIQLPARQAPKGG